MAKRLHDDAGAASNVVDDDRALKKLKKEKKRKVSTDGDAHVTAETEVESIQNGEKSVPEKTADAAAEATSKAERKALKRAKKEAERAKAAHGAAGAVSEATGDSDAAAKAERKAKRRAEKAAAKVSSAGDALSHTVNGPLTTEEPNGVHHIDTVNGVTTGYTEAAALTALPQSEIDEFIAEKFITIDDPSKDKYRPITSFKYLPVTDDAQRAPFASYSTPTPIQAAAWPYLLSGRDVIGVAETGSGKTLAFGVPCIRYISSLEKRKRKGIKACIVSPTRELAVQIHEQLVKLAEPAGLKCTVVYGGVNKDAQRETLNGTHIVVATPGRLNDYVSEGSIDLSNADYLVLDEADRMLDKGFEEDIRKIISGTAASGRQTLMFTATWPESVRKLASTFMSKPVRISIGDNPTGELRANAKIVQQVEVMDQQSKQQRLIEVLKQYQSGKNKKDRILVFCLYKKEATRIEEFIGRRGFAVAGIHGDLNQAKRSESLEAFKTGRVPCLVATDVAARGLDIPAVKVVINVTFPLTVEDYVHRIGR